MADYVKCPSCNYPIGMYYNAFLEMRKILNAPSSISFEDPRDALLFEGGTPCSEIFDELSISNWCCRMHMMTIHDPYESYYNRK